MRVAENDVVLFTGFPGSLATAVLPRILTRLPDADALCLVAPADAERARVRAARLTTDDPSLRGRIRFVAADLAHPRLGLANRDFMPRVAEIVHLAAIVDPAMPRDMVWRANVDGTQRLVDLSRDSGRLRRFHHVSTCAVSGRWRGPFTEGMLDEGQEFPNHCDESRQHAELRVRQAVRTGLSATIYRPAVVVGDSVTGETESYDGPYPLVQWLVRHSGRALVPAVHDTRRVELNLVPRDFVASAISWLGGRVESLGRTYALADPAPLAVDALLDVMVRAAGRSPARVALPLPVLSAVLRLPGMQALTRMPARVLDQFTNTAHYDTAHAVADLAPSHIRCPRFESYVASLVAYVRAHPDAPGLTPGSSARGPRPS